MKILPQRPTPADRIDLNHCKSSRVASKNLFNPTSTFKKKSQPKTTNKIILPILKNFTLFDYQSDCVGKLENKLQNSFSQREKFIGIPFEGF